MPDWFAHHLPPGKTWFSTREVAEMLGRTPQWVRDCFDNQKLLGHITNGKAHPGREQRRPYRIHRDSLLLFLAQTANYTPREFTERIAHILTQLPPGTRTQILNRATPPDSGTHYPGAP